MVDRVRPSGVVTFLFTDIEGSTRLWEADPEGMRAALALHDEVLASSIESAGGWLFKHTGDGVCAAFSSPNDAVNAAIAAQRALELPVRMGIATGEVQRRDDDYFGPALNRAARVMDAGHGGQVLVASVAAALVDGVDLLDLGSRRLRDLSEPVGIFQVQADELPTEFPALRTLDETPGNLRALSSSFVGRATELADVVAAVGSHRLVTIVGVGGVGKTRLALQAAAELAPAFPEGVFVVELAAIGEPLAVPDAVATVLGILQQPDRTMTESIAATLADRQRLLVLDNCEHLLDAVADLVETLLGGGESVKVLATSREGLRVGDEHVWTVPSLGVREGADSEAVALFVERSRAAVHDFTLDRGDEEAAVVEICRRLDGIPLAIELAASRMVSMSPADVRDRLDDRFRLLSGSRRGLERHQTLRHAVQWSYDLLHGDEQAMLQTCSVFAGGFDVAAAIAVGNAEGEVDEYHVLDVLDALVRKSLLVVDRSASTTQYSMLETIRQFAEQELAAAGHGDTTRDAHAAHYATRMAEVVDAWEGPGRLDGYRWFDTNFANLRAAFRWATEHDDIDTAAAIATRASLLGWEQEQSEPATWAEEILPAARAVNHRKLVELYGVAATCCVTGRLADALEYSRAGLALIDDRYYDRDPVDRLIQSLAVPFSVTGQVEEFLEVLRRYYANEPDPHISGRTTLLTALALTGRYEEAVEKAPGVIAAAEATNDPYYVTYALMAGAFAWREIDPPQALALTRRAMDVVGTSSRIAKSFLAQLLTQLESECGDPEAALDAAAFAIRRYHDSGNTSTLKGALGILALPLERLGHAEAAATLTGSAALDLAAQAVWAAIADAAERLRDALGNDVFDQLAAQGAAMTTADIVTFALGAIEHARDNLAD